MNFPQAFKILIGHEGKYQNDYWDRGNWKTGRVGLGKRTGTKFGISSMTYPDIPSIKDMSLDTARKIYRRDFWDKVQAESLPETVRFEVFDMAVNAGISTSSKILQKACGAKPDGKIGKNTLAKANSIDPSKLFVSFCAHRIIYYSRLGLWKKYGKGWTLRVAKNMLVFARKDTND